MKCIEITIATDGEAKVETQGFVGPACQDASRFLETALGKKSNEKLKLEFHQVSEFNQQRASE